jgi:hypothetical protein
MIFLNTINFQTGHLVDRRLKINKSKDIEIVAEYGLMNNCHTAINAKKQPITSVLYIVGII